MSMRRKKPETDALIASSLGTGVLQDVVLPAQECEDLASAIERVASFGERHGLSLGGTTIRELREEARP